MMKALASVALAGLLVTGCTTGRDLSKIPGYGQGSGKRIDGSMLRQEANPSEVVATDIAFSRAARDTGQWTAFRKYAADGALMHRDDGTFEAGPWLARQTDPAVPVQWTPIAVWSSCDGSTAVTQGKFRDPNGQWGFYVTVWERQDDGRYRWVYDMGAPDDELTARENAAPPPRPEGEDVIVVQAVEAIRANVAECLSMDEFPPPAVLIASMTDATGVFQSDDKTFTANWRHSARGERELYVREVSRSGFEKTSILRVGPNGKIVPTE